ncbi:hypothetical protein GIB67_031017 [Kingdonia uniflora]|uniref:Uncharacterized protein n=1 Tax=Kingdonia uniflora TaxID=39325 RepID=A0A7J7NGP4_9MAGN|nr:hypothetical protein GIB67_031017 [Kingdonia uniflora]
MKALWMSLIAPKIYSARRLEDRRKRTTNVLTAPGRKLFIYQKDLTQVKSSKEDKSGSIPMCQRSCRHKYGSTPK